MISASAYARRRGCALQTVIDAINQGRLVSSFERLMNGRYSIDPDLADKEWAANTNCGTGGAAHLKRLARADVAQGATGYNDQHRTYAEARTQHECFKARLAQLELEQREGRLVKAEAVKREAFRVARLVRDSMLNIPDRVAGELAAETNKFKVHQRLVSEIRRALENLDWNENQQNL